MTPFKCHYYNVPTVYILHNHKKKWVPNEFLPIDFMPASSNSNTNEEQYQITEAGFQLGQI